MTSLGFNYQKAPLISPNQTHPFPFTPLNCRPPSCLSPEKPSLLLPLHLRSPPHLPPCVPSRRDSGGHTAALTAASSSRDLFRLYLLLSCSFSDEPEHWRRRTATVKVSFTSFCCSTSHSSSPLRFLIFLFRLSSIRPTPLNFKFPATIEAFPATESSGLRTQGQKRVQVTSFLCFSFWSRV